MDDSKATKTLDQHIEITPGVAGDRPRIAGHRITVEDVAIWHERLGMSADEIASEYDLSLADIYATLAYYFDHRGEIDKSIEEGEAFVEGLRQSTPSLLQKKLELSLVFVGQASALEGRLLELLASPAIKFDDAVRHALPEDHGVYRIFDPADPEETVRAGRTKTAAGALRQRVYQNHFMGDQKGNLRRQLVSEGSCLDMEAAKRFIRDNLAVQILLVHNDEERIWLEHFMLAILRPRFCD